MASESEIYRQIERRYSFAVPDDYRRMCEAGWFAFDDSNNRVGPNYVWLNEMEWLRPAQIRDHTFPNYCKPGFVPFATTGGSDHWCWYPAETVDWVTPVVLCPLDCDDGEFYVPDFLGSLYRQMLDYVVDTSGEEEGVVRGYLSLWSDRIGQVFPNPWRTTLAELHAAPLRSWESTRRSKHVGLLSPEECGSIVRRDLAFAKLDQKLKWMIPLASGEGEKPEKA